MISPVSSMTAIEHRSLRRPTVSTADDLTTYNVCDVRFVPQSAATRADVRLKTLADVFAVLEKALENKDVVTGTLTCVGDLMIFDSPTLRLSTEPFQFIASIPSEDPASESRLLNSTDRTQGVSSFIESKLTDAIALARGEWFEDGIESQLSRALSTLLHTYGSLVVAPLETFFGAPTSDIAIAVEAAQWLGEVDHKPSQKYRRTLLEKLLRASSTRLRHGAAAGLAAMNDPSSLAALHDVFGREENTRLRRYLELVIEQLERARACPSS